MENVYLREFTDLFQMPSPDSLEWRLGIRVFTPKAARVYGDEGVYTACRIMVKRYAWSIPDETALAVVAGRGPLVSIGAGTGYWEALLRSRGVTVHAYDERPPRPFPPAHGFTSWEDFLDKPGPCVSEKERVIREADINLWHAGMNCWTEVLRGGPEDVGKHPDCTLFLSWPPRSGMASECLDYFTGRYLIYVGEGNGGCTADSDFHERLELDFEMVEEVNIPQWQFVHDDLAVYRRRGS
jgi:hypothetical protein